MGNKEIDVPSEINKFVFAEGEIKCGVDFDQEFKVIFTLGLESNPEISACMELTSLPRFLNLLTEGCVQSFKMEKTRYPDIFQAKDLDRKYPYLGKSLDTNLGTKEVSLIKRELGEIEEIEYIGSVGNGLFLRQSYFGPISIFRPLNRESDYISQWISGNSGDRINILKLGKKEKIEIFESITKEKLLEGLWSKWNRFIAHIPKKFFS